MSWNCPVFDSTGKVKDVAAGNPLNLPLLDTANIEYLGRFLLPTNTDPWYGNGFAYAPGQGGGGIAYNAANNSLFIAGYGPNGNHVVAEVSIPAAKTSAYNRASLLQTFVKGCDARQSDVNTGANGNQITGMLVHNGRLLISVAGMYLEATDGPQTNAVFARDSLNLSTSSVLGPAAVSSVDQRRVGAGLGGEVPSVWQSTFGGNKAIIGGGGGLSTGNYFYPHGPTIIFFNPDDVTGTASVSGTAACYYTSQYTLGALYGPFTDTFTGMSCHRGTIMLENYRTVLCYGKHGDSYYSGGNMADVLVDRFWLYDAAELKDAFDGTVSAADGVLPYATFDMNFSDTTSGGENAGTRGCTFDAANNLIYAIEQGAGGASHPAVHVLRLNI